MNNKKGFTLIELLAVILILGIIALIAIPTVNNVISQARKGANEQTTNNYVKAAEQKCEIAMLNKETFEGIYDISELSDMVKGDKNLNGYFEVDSECNVQIVVTSSNDSKNCYKKAFGEDTASSYELSDGQSCLAEQKEVSETECFATSNNDTGLTITAYLCGGKVNSAVGATIEEASEGKYKVTDYTASDKMDVVIPSVIDGKPVTEIGPLAFSCFTTLDGANFILDTNSLKLVRSVVIPSSVKKIDAYAFTGNIIEDLTLSYGVEIIGDRAFTGNGISSLYMPNSIKEVGTDAFAVNKSLKSVYISSGLSALSENLFAQDPITGTIVIPNGVKTIGLGVFFDSNISGNLVIPDSVESIGWGAFAHTKITSISFGNGLKEIAPNSFSDCFNLSGEVVIPDSVTSIGFHAFSNDNITKVVIGKGVTNLEHGAFRIKDDDNSNMHLTSIVNKTGKVFNWRSILYNIDDSKCTFETGSCSHYSSLTTVITKE